MVETIVNHILNKIAGEKILNAMFKVETQGSTSFNI